MPLLVPVAAPKEVVVRDAGGNVTYTPEVWTGSPNEYKLANGKYAGKTLGELLTVDPKYLQYLRSSGSPDFVKDLAGKVLDSKPTMPTPVVADAPTPPPTGDTSSVVSPPSDQKAMVAECKALLNKVGEFKGAGLGTKMIPFLKQINPTKIDYTDWSVGELHTLKSKLNEKLGVNPINPSLSA